MGIGSRPPSEEQQIVVMAAIDVLRLTSINATTSSSREHPIERVIIGLVVVPPEPTMLVANVADNVNDSGSGPR